LSRSQVAAKVLYLAGSVVFLVVAVARQAPLLIAGSLLFALGSLLLLVPVARRRQGTSPGRSRR
jgi:hypothetical protein